MHFSAEFLALFPLPPKILLFCVVPPICHAYIPQKVSVLQLSSTNPIPFQTFLNMKSIKSLLSASVGFESCHCNFLFMFYPTGRTLTYRMTLSPASPLGSDCRTESLFLLPSHLPFLKFVGFLALLCLLHDPPSFISACSLSRKGQDCILNYPSCFFFCSFLSSSGVQIAYLELLMLSR